MKFCTLLLALLLLPCTAMAFNPPSPPDPTNPPDGPLACSGNTLQPGESTRTITIGDQRRSYILAVPSSYSARSEVPLLLDFHALRTTSSYQRRNSGTLEVSQHEGFIVAYPQGIDNAWNIGPCCTESRDVDDVGFARAIVEEVAAQGCVDEKRVYATGYSNGGGMAYTLACRAADMFAAIAPAAFDMIEEMNCNPSRPVSVFSHRGRRDSIVPYEGGRSTPPTGYRLDPITFLGAEGSFNGETVKPRANGKYDSYGKYGRENCNYVRNIDGTPAK